MKAINNDFYESLNDLWHEGEDHPAALLRAENAARNPWISSLIAERYPKGCTILDVGCGGGLLTNTLAAKGHEVYGIDLSPSSLRSAAQRDATGRVSYRQAAAENLPFEKDSFDVVCAMDLLEHVERPEQVIAEASRVLKRGGLFFFHTFNPTLLSWLLVIKGVEWFVRNTPPAMHLYRLFLKPESVSELCSLHHIKVEKMVGLLPDVKSYAFWRMLITRRVSPHFRFVFSSSLKVGYSGYGSLIGQESGDSGD
jgi:2-polyprenyl-6-hydroxyphenyl methylase / 3-demethylubiquinone-9 3-methyltransferase